MARPDDLRKSLPGLRRILPRFLPYIRKHRALTGGSFAVLFAEVAFRLLEPWPLKFVVDRVIVDTPAGGESGLAVLDRLDPMNLLGVCALALVLIIGLRALCSYASTVEFALIGNRMLTEVRGDLYSHLQRLSLSFHTKAKGGDLTIRLISDIGLLKDVVVTALMPFMVNILILVGMLGVMFILNWQLALLALVTLPLFGLSTVRLSKRIHGESRKVRQRQGAMAATASESIGAIKIVQALSLEGIFDRSFSAQNIKSLKEGVQVKRLASRMERGGRDDRDLHRPGPVLRGSARDLR